MKKLLKWEPGELIDRLTGNETMEDKLIDQILKKVESETGVNRLDFTSNSRREIYLEARKKATKLLIEEAQLSDEGIAKVLGVSKSTANTYRIILGYRRRY